MSSGKRMFMAPGALGKNLAQTVKEKAVAPQTMKEKALAPQTMKEKALAPGTLGKNFGQTVKEKAPASQTMKEKALAPGTLGKNFGQTVKEKAPASQTMKEKALASGTLGKNIAQTSVVQKNNTFEAPRNSGSPQSPPRNALTPEDLRSSGDSTSHVEVITQDGHNIPQPHSDTHIEEQAATEIEGSLSVKSKKRSKNFKPRGPNKCRRLGNLKEGEKLEVTFYQNGAVGDNHHLFTSYMGLLVKNRFTVPIRVHRWNDIDEVVKDHLWASVSSKFKGKDFDLDRHDTLCHMRKLWHCWRGYLVQKYINPAGTKENALAKGPKSIPQADWEWLVTEHFFDPEVLKVRIRNSENRAELKMLHRTGCAPFRHIAYDQMGGKEGNDPTIAQLFKKTREKKGGELDEDSACKLKEIIETAKDNPGFSAFELVEKNFGPQDRGHVACFGYGLKPKDVRGELKSRAELEAIIRDKDREIQDKDREKLSLLKRMDNMEDQVQKLADLYMEEQRSKNNAQENVDNVDVADNVDELGRA